MHNCPLWAPKQTSARIDFLRQGKRLVDKKALIMLKFLLKVRQNDYAACTREWATAQRSRTRAPASASGCRACCPRPTETTPCKRRSNLPLAARLSTCRERMEQLPPGRFLKHSHVLPQTNGKHPIFAVFFRYVLFPTFVQKICLHSTKQMFTVFVVLLLICVRESSAYVNSYVVMTSTLLTVVSMCFIIALATASSCSIGDVVALLCITSRWRRAV